jgi:very-short-patch-repair endonuclease
METLKQYKEKQKRNSRYIVELRKKATKSELIFKKMLDENNVKYIFQKGFISKGFHCIVDFYIPKRKICFEIDGGVHLSKMQIEKDRKKDNYLIKTRGFTVIRIKNEDVKNVNILELFLYRIKK